MPKSRLVVGFLASLAVSTFCAAAQADPRLGLASADGVVLFETSGGNGSARQISVTGLQESERLVGVGRAGLGGRLPDRAMFAVTSEQRVLTIDPVSGAGTEVAFVRSITDTSFGNSQLQIVFTGAFEGASGSGLDAPFEMLVWDNDPDNKMLTTLSVNAFESGDGYMVSSSELFSQAAAVSLDESTGRASFDLPWHDSWGASGSASFAVSSSY